MSNYEPCSICEEYIEGVICNKDKCPIWKMKKENAEQKAEIERLRKEIDDLEYHLDCECSTSADVSSMLIGEEKAKAEAIKEFAERFLSIAQRVDRDDVDELILIRRDCFDNFVKKEMAGDT